MSFCVSVEECFRVLVWAFMYVALFGVADGAV